MTGEANTTSESVTAAPAYQPRSEAAAIAIGAAGWLIPGLGHAVLKMWGRAVACFLTVGLLVLIGVGLRGNIFSSDAGDAFGMLGYIADLGTGCFYFAARAWE